MPPPRSGGIINKRVDRQTSSAIYSILIIMLFVFLLPLMLVNKDYHRASRWKWSVEEILTVRDRRAAIWRCLQWSDGTYAVRSVRTEFSCNLIQQLTSPLGLAESSRAATSEHYPITYHQRRRVFPFKHIRTFSLGFNGQPPYSSHWNLRGNRDA